MKKTKVVNETGSNIILKEGTGGVYRMLCSELKTGEYYIIRVDTNATYREYWCAVTPEDEKHVVLSSDDCMEFEEVRIRFKEDNTYTWDAVKRGSHELVVDAGDREASKQPQTQAQGGTTGERANPREPGVVSKLWNKAKGWFS